MITRLGGIFTIVVCCGTLGACTGLSRGGLETGKVEELSIPSVTPTSVSQLEPGASPAPKSVTVTGTLYLPKNGTPPYPAMLVMHGSGGLTYQGEQMDAWAQQLNIWNIAALVIDSFTARGVTETVTDQSRLSEWAEVADAFAGLKLLASNPVIDPHRIGIIGFSRGGSVALYTALNTPRHAMLTGNLDFANHIAFYPYCNGEMLDKATDKSPVLFLQGEADDYTPIGPCRQYAKWFASMGDQVTFVGYPGAYHGFDIPGAGVGYVGSAQAYVNCDYAYDLAQRRYLRVGKNDNPTVSPEQFKEYLASCFVWGAHVTSDDEARQRSIEQVHHFLAADFAKIEHAKTNRAEGPSSVPPPEARAEGLSPDQ
jgi:dienelactone hydrolase